MQEPKFIITEKKIYEQIDILENIFDEISYSWKTNPKIGDILNKTGKYFISVHGMNEISQVETKEKLRYFTLAVTDEELEKVMIEWNTRDFVVDNLKDLDTLINFIEKHNIKINLLLRMKLRENTIFTGKHYVFGMKVKDIKESIDKLHDHKLIGSLGVHFHRKTQNVSEWTLRDEVEQSLGDEYLKKIDTMNLGGGLPGKYENSHDREVESIFSKIKDLRKYTDKFNIRLIIEPGRFVASPSVRMECSIIAIHDNTCFVNTSVFNGMLDTIVANVKLIIKEEIERKEGEAYTIKGMSPDSADILRYRVYLKNPKVGNKLTFLNCGAYTYNTNFCGLKEIETVIE